MSELLSINVNGHTEKKNGLTYLSWAWAWSEVLKIDPLATWTPMFNGPQGSESPWFLLPDGSMLVGVSVTIKQHAKQCMLPVMDHRNKAIKDPDAFAVNTALMRCLAKCIAMHGLGLYIYAGEDLPEDGEPGKPVKQGGGPTDGATDTLTTAQREYVSKVAGAIEKKMGADNAWGAYEELVHAIERVTNSKGDAQMFEVSLYKALPAQTRAALDAMKADERARA